jgi:hypothetical protein
MMEFLLMEVFWRPDFKDWNTLHRTIAILMLILHVKAFSVLHRQGSMPFAGLIDSLVVFYFQK